jgi:predicted N-acetyltransferase YhbS
MTRAMNSRHSISATEAWSLRLAREADVPAIEALIPASVRVLQMPYYSAAQMEAALSDAIFGVDRQLIRDGTYFVAEWGDVIVGCGGWSRRRTLSGGDRGRTGEDELLDPQRDAARVRAFFVHPDWARRGIGHSIMTACEKAIFKAGFREVVIVATLAGEQLYATFGYRVEARYDLPMSHGLGLPVGADGQSVIVPLSAWERVRRSFLDSLITGTSRQAIQSGKTSPCGWGCAGLPGSRMRFQRSWKTWNTTSPCISCTTTFAGFIPL